MATLGGVSLMDFSAIGNLPKTIREGRMHSNRERTLADLGQSGDYSTAGRKLLSAGDLEGGIKLLTIGESLKKSRQEDEASRSLMELFKPQSAAPAAPAASGGGRDYGSAISSIESGGKYEALGPIITSGAYAGDRAYGKYQVMGKNVGPWTREVLGKEMSPQEFAANPQAQDAVFKSKFGQLVSKHGEEGAARAWFAGEGGMNDPSRKDQLGTSVGAYGQKFMANLGPAGTTDVSAQRGPGSQPVADRPFTPNTDVLQNPEVRRWGAVAVHPRMPSHIKDFAKTLLEHTIKGREPTGDQKDYMLAVEQGETDTFTDWTRKNKSAGSTKVSIDQKGESEFEKEFGGKAQAKRWAGIQEAGDAAERRLVDITTMREIHTRLGSQGAVAGLKEFLGPYAEALGVNLEGLSDIQAYSQVIQRLAPQQRAPGSGSTSDIEFKGFLKSLPTLSQNPQARQIGLDTMEALARDDMARGAIASKLATKEIDRSTAEKMLRALPDPMKGFIEWRKANPQVYGNALRPAQGAPQGGSPAEATPQQSAPQGAPDGARRGRDGLLYVPDPSRPGKYLRVD
jgi:hypothetical protein